jgi:hypothetical protein
MDSAAYLLDVVRGFRNYKMLGDAAMAQVPSDADFDRMLDVASNSIAVSTSPGIFDRAFAIF